MKTKSRRLLSTLLALAMVLSLIYVVPMSAGASDQDTIDLSESWYGYLDEGYGSYWEYDSTLNMISVYADVEITGTATSLAPLIIRYMADGVTVRWTAQFIGAADIATPSSLVVAELELGNTFTLCTLEIPTGGSITAAGGASALKSLDPKIAIIISGGAVTAEDGSAIIGNNITISDGTVSANGVNAPTIPLAAGVDFNMSGGTVTANGPNGTAIAGADNNYIEVANGSPATINGLVTLSGDCAAIKATGSSVSLFINGDVVFESDRDGKAIDATSGAEIIITGDVTFEGSISGGGVGISADAAIVTIDGFVVFDKEIAGDARGVYSVDSGVINITKDVTFGGDIQGHGVRADDGYVYITGSVIANDVWNVLIYSVGAAFVDIGGDVIGECNLICANDGSAVNVDGNATATGTGDDTAYVVWCNYAVLKISGNVVAASATSTSLFVGVQCDGGIADIGGDIVLSDGIGAYALSGGIITVEGEIYDAPTYIKVGYDVDTVIKTIYDNELTTTKDGYREYRRDPQLQAGDDIVWVSQRYTVTFNANGGTVNPESGKTSKDYGKGEGATLSSLPTPIRNGYIFIGWHTEQDGGNPVTLEYPYFADITIYALWAKVHTVTFNANGGTVDPTSGTTSPDYGSGATLSSLPTPTWSGYVFIGWYRNQDSSKLLTLEDLYSYDTTIYALWAKVHTVTFDPNEGTVDPTSGTTSPDYGEGATLSSLPTPTRDGYTFDGWFRYPDGDEKVDLDHIYYSDETIYAHWTRIPDPPPAPPAPPSTKYTITYNAGGGTGTMANDSVSKGANYTIKENAFTRVGFAFVGWNTKADGTGTLYADKASIDNVTQDITLYAIWRLTLESDSHIRYIIGYPDGSVKPEKAITRAEAATVFYRLTKASDKTDAITSNFTDMKPDDWFYQAVAYLEKYGLIVDSPNGKFRPNEPITRAEYAALAAGFDKLDTNAPNAFPDVPNDHWAVGYINSAAIKGWVQGFEDGTFKPEATLTRAQLVTIVNRMLNRVIDLEDIPATVVKYTDLKSDHWAYCALIEASTEHSYTRKANNSEIWN